MADMTPVQGAHDVVWMQEKLNWVFPTPLYAEAIMSGVAAGMNW